MLLFCYGTQKKCGMIIWAIYIDIIHITFIPGSCQAQSDSIFKFFLKLESLYTKQFTSAFTALRSVQT